MPGQFVVPLKSAVLFQRLASLFALQVKTEQPEMALWPLILPTMDMSGPMESRKHGTTAALNIEGAVWGVYVEAFKVPTGKRWRVWAISVEGLASSSLITVSATSTPATYKDALIIGPVSVTATTIGYAKDYPVYPVVLEEGWSLGLWTTGVASGDTARKMNIIYSEEDRLQ